MEKHPLHLKNPDLQTSPEVSKAVEKKERLSGQKVPNDPSERIEAYTERLEGVFLNKDRRVRERNIEMLRDGIEDAYLIKRNDVPESYFELQKRVARERGQTVEEIPQEMRERMVDTVIEDQRASLNAWIDYLASDDAVYPAWFKYFVWQNVTKLSQFDKELGRFKERTSSTVASFPDIYREPLAQIADLYEAYPQTLKETEPKLQKLRAERKSLKKELDDAEGSRADEIKVRMEELEQEIAETSVPLEAFSKKFPTLYAELIQKSLAAQFESKEGTEGEWMKYEQGDMSQAETLYDSLQNKGTGWCTAGRSTAETQVESGDFYVYYTYDDGGKLSQPRIAVRMEDSRIAEVRGILPHQQLEPMMADILEAKLQEFGSEADVYKKRSRDMRLLTELEKKTAAGEALTKDELVFLYEINEPIEGFGYEEDPRIEELRSQRNAEEDAPIVLGCSPEEIAWSRADINENTKAYIGPLYPGVFDADLEYIFTSFPEGNLPEYSVELGGKSKEAYRKELEERDTYISSYAGDLLNSRDFETLSTPEHVDLIRLTVEDLGFPNGATTDEIYAKAIELGLELCPAETGPALRLSYTGTDWMYIGMKQISERDGYPLVFRLYEVGGRLKLHASFAEPEGTGGIPAFGSCSVTARRLNSLGIG